MRPDNKVMPRQRGAALVVGLVLLMVLTLLAVSTMRTASLELVMAGNTQFRENAFRLAEIALADGMDQSRTGLVATPGWSRAIANGAPIAELRGTYDATVSFVGTGRAYGSFSPSEFQFAHYRVDGTGRTDQRGARADLAQGFIRVVPLER